jgi:hypothetical protein
VLAPFDPPWAGQSPPAPGRPGTPLDSGLLHAARSAPPASAPTARSPISRRSRSAGSWRRAAKVQDGGLRRPARPTSRWFRWWAGNATPRSSAPVVGTFHTYSTSRWPNYIANASARAVSSTDSLRGLRFPRPRRGPGGVGFGGNYTIVPTASTSMRRRAVPARHRGAADPLRRPARRSARACRSC